jgi:hypothetical protein
MLALPTDLSDEAAAKLLQWLYDFATIIENHYADQIRRYYATPQTDPLPPSDDPPF